MKAYRAFPSHVHCKAQGSARDEEKQSYLINCRGEEPHKKPNQLAHTEGHMNTRGGKKAD